MSWRLRDASRIGTDEKMRNPLGLEQRHCRFRSFSTDSGKQGKDPVFHDQFFHQLQCSLGLEPVIPLKEKQKPSMNSPLVVKILEIDRSTPPDLSIVFHRPAQGLVGTQHDLARLDSNLCKNPGG